MFENLSERLLRTVKNLRGQGRLTEDNIKDALREVRMALLEADVALPVVREFINRVRERAIGEEVLLSLTPGQVLIKIVHEELIRVMGEANAELNLRVQPPAVVLMAGLQGSGKTTSIAKLAQYYKRRGRRVVVAAADTFRAAAIDQLKIWGERVGVEVIAQAPGADPGAVVFDAIRASQESRRADLLIIDTAGRLHTKFNLMKELEKVRSVAARQVHAAPHETLLVLDATTGQNAISQAKHFKDSVQVSGLILAKLDSTAKGGIVFAIEEELGLPVRFVGTGEKADDFAEFDPRAFVDGILG